MALRSSARASCPGASSLPRSGTCSSQASCLLAVGSVPLTDFRRLPRDSASTSRLSSSRRSLASFRCYPVLGSLPLLRLPPLGSYPVPCPPSPFGSSGPPMTLSRRSSQNDGRARSPSAFHTNRGMLTVSGSPTHSRFEAFRLLASATRLLCVSTGGAETVPPDALDLSASCPECKARIRDPNRGYLPEFGCAQGCGEAGESLRSARSDHDVRRARWTFGETIDDRIHTCARSVESGSRSRRATKKVHARARNGDLFPARIDSEPQATRARSRRSRHRQRRTDAPSCRITGRARRR